MSPCRITLGRDLVGSEEAMAEQKEGYVFRYSAFVEPRLLREGSIEMMGAGENRGLDTIIRRRIVQKYGISRAGRIDLASQFSQVKERKFRSKSMLSTTNNKHFVGLSAQFVRFENYSAQTM